VRIAHRVLIAACIACGAALGAAPALAFRYTHSVTISGKFVDTWTRTPVADCSLQGSGATTIDFAWTKAWKVAPRIDPFSDAHGRWVLFILLADRNHPRPADVFSDPLALPTRTILVTDLPGRLTRQTTTFSGGATRVGTDCDPLTGKPCATKTRTRKSDLTGKDRRKLSFEASLDMFTSEGACNTGTINSWSSPIFKNQNELLVRMPKPKTLARRKTVVINASDSGHQTTDDTFGSSVDETVTRSVTVTFKKL
jgi:hypothetical protein